MCHTRMVYVNSEKMEKSRLLELPCSPVISQNRLPDEKEKRRTDGVKPPHSPQEYVLLLEASPLNQCAHQRRRQGPKRRERAFILRFHRFWYRYPDVCRWNDWGFVRGRKMKKFRNMHLGTGFQLYIKINMKIKILVPTSPLWNVIIKERPI